MQLRPETLQIIVDEIASHGIAPETSKTIVSAVIEWYEEMRKVQMRISTKGRKVGRPRTMTPAVAAKARRLRSTGLSFRVIGERLGVHHKTVWYELLPRAERAKYMKRIRENVDRWRARRAIPI